jgi:glutamyl-tRNA reductase
MTKHKKDIKTYPVNLLLKGKNTLVVGGGKVATRKVNGLLNSQSNMTVIAPKVSKAIAKLAEEGRLRLFERKFEKSDLNNISLLFAATDDRAFNSSLINLCSDLKILCCAVDENWSAGGFITPASFERDGVNVAVSSHGEACRKTRLIKENLSRHIEMTDNTEFLVLGTDHNYMNLTEREHLHLTGQRYQQTGEMLRHIGSIHEFMLLNTCNRVELIAIVSPGPGFEGILKAAMHFNNIQNDDFYLKYGIKAFSHFITVMSGLMSQTPGEKHITAQIKDTLKVAKSNNWASNLLQECQNTALHISKHIRQKLDTFMHNFEIEDLTLKYIKNECKALKGSNALVIGTGTIGTAMVDNLLKEGCHVTWCYHTSKQEKKRNLRIVNINNLKDNLLEIDLIVSASSSESPLLHHGHAPFMDQDRVINIIDLAIPRDVSPELKKLMPNIKLADLDDLKHWHRRESIDMAHIFEISNAIINEHKNMYDKIFSPRN